MTDFNDTRGWLLEFPGLIEQEAKRADHNEPEVSVIKNVVDIEEGEFAVDEMRHGQKRAKIWRVINDQRVPYYNYELRAKSRGYEIHELTERRGLIKRIFG